MKKFTLQDAKDILVTGVEGGINYWAYTTKYDPDRGRVMIYEHGEDYELISKTLLTVTDILHKLLECKLYSEKNVLGIDFDDIDSVGADQIIQFVLFGEVKYG